MRRFDELFGRSVVAQDVGVRVTDLADLVADGERMVAVILTGGVLGSQRVLPLSEVGPLGEDTVDRVQLPRDAEHG